MRLYASAIGPAFVLLDNNARSHRAAIVEDYLESEGIAYMACPAHRPPLIPLKIFGILSAALYLHVSHPTLIELKTALQEE